MRNLRALVILAALSAACVPVTGSGGGAVRSTTVNGNQGAWVPAAATVSGNNASVVVFSTTTSGDNVRGLSPGLERVGIQCRFNQAVTVLYQTLAAGSTTWRTQNGSGSGDAVTANADFWFDYLVKGPDVRIVVVTGGTGPTTREVSIRVSNDRAPGV